MGIFNGDNLRGTQAKFDAWEQITNEANPYINQLLEEADPDQQNMIWDEQSTRNVYDQQFELKIATIDSLNHRTIYFYDLDKRLVLEVDAEGRITQYTLNSFGETEVTRHYENRIESDQLPLLNGGFFDENIQSLLEPDDSKDVVLKKKYDNRGSEIEITSPLNAVTTKSYTAFKQCDQESIQIDANNTMVINHQFEQRGLEIKTTKSSNEKKIVTSSEYNNPYGHLTKHIDERGQESNIDYDMRGDHLKLTKNLEEGLQLVHQFETDAFHRDIQIIDSNGNQTKVVYNEETNSKKIIYPVNDTNKKITQNIFGETITEIDALGNTKTWQHTPTGKNQVETNALQNSITRIFNTEDRLTDMIDFAGMVIHHEYDGSYLEIKSIDDYGQSGMNLTHQFIRSGIGYVEERIDPRNIHHKNKYDQDNNLLQEITDPDNLKLVKNYAYNLQHGLLMKSEGDHANQKQYEEKILRDEFNRETGLVKDPKFLRLSDQDTLDNAGDVVLEVDANQRKTWTFRDLSGKPRFTLKNEGQLVEIQYDQEELEIFKRQYDKFFDTGNITENTTLEQMKSLVKNISDDTKDAWERIWYDGNKRERFRMDGNGVLVEKRYNEAGFESDKIYYAQTLTNPQQYISATLKQILEAAQQIRDEKNDHHYQYVFDGNHNLRFTLDPEGYLHERRYDKSSRLITKITYATPNQNLNQIKIDNENDSYYITIYDVLGRELFLVDPEGRVLGKTYDENDNQLTHCAYQQTVILPQDYDQLKTQLLSWKPNPAAGDQLEQIKYDEANRQTAWIDALGFQEDYELNALGLMQSKTLRPDAYGQRASWRMQYDAAKRQTDLITPPVEIATIAYQNKQLTSSVEKTSATTHYEYDKKENKTSVTLAYGTTEARTVFNQYNSQDQILTNTQKNVSVDDSTKDSSFSQRPEKLVDLIRTQNYNAKGKVISEQAEDGGWVFHVYDQQSQERYRLQQIDENHFCVIEYQYNAFGLVKEQIAYYQPISLNPNDYVKKQIAIDELQKLIKSSTKDHHTSYQYDKRNLEIQKQDGQIFYYTVAGWDENQNQPATHSGFARPTTKTTWNAIKKRVGLEKLVSIDQQGKSYFNSEYTWYDRSGLVVVECDLLDLRPNKNKISTKKIQYNAFKQHINQRQLATNLLEIPTEATTLSQINQQIDAVKNDSIDHQTIWTWTGRNELKSETIVQETVFKTQNGITQSSIKNLTTDYEWSADGYQIKKIFSDGGSEYHYYDALGQLKAKVESSRNSFNDNFEPILVTPLSYYQRNIHGEQVFEKRFVQGTSTEQSTNQFPQPLQEDNEHDQIIMSMHDQRGLKIWIQDATGNVKGFTFKESKAEARTYYLVDDLTYNGSVAQSQKNRRVETPFLATFKNGQQIQFKQKLDYLHRNSGFEALEVNRKTLVKELLSLKDDQKSLEFLADEIKTVFEQSSFLMVKNEIHQKWTNLFNHKLLAKNKFEGVFLKIKKEKLKENYFGLDKPEYLVEWLSKNNCEKEAQFLLQLQKEIDVIEEQLVQFYQSKEVFEYYLNQYHESQLELGYKTAVLYAQQKGIHLRVFKKHETSHHLLHEIETIQPTEIPTKKVHLIKHGNDIHFYALQEYQKIKEGKQEVEALSSIQTTQHLDEKRRIYDFMHREILTQFMRDKNLIRVFTRSFNPFGECENEGDANNNHYVKSQYNAIGKCISTNGKTGFFRINTYTLLGSNSAVMESPVIDLSTYTENTLPELISLSPELLERTQIQGDNFARKVADYLPAYSTTAFKGAENLFLAVQVITDKDIDGLPILNGKTYVRWHVPPQQNYQRTLKLYPKGYPEKALPMIMPTLQNKAIYEEIDVSDFVSGIYDYELNFQLINPFTKALDENIVYQSTGEIQILTAQQKNTQDLLISTAYQSSRVWLLGNTKNLQTVDVYQEDVSQPFLTEVPVIYDLQKQCYAVELESLVPTGRYQIKANNILSVATPVYTSMPPNQPFNYEIPADVSIQTLQTHGELRWTLPEKYAQQRVRFSCNYIDDQGIRRVLSAIILDKKTPSVIYKDGNQKEIYSNFDFDYSVKEITEIRLSVEWFQKTTEQQSIWIPLYQNVAPSPRALKQRSRVHELKLNDGKILTLLEPLRAKDVRSIFDVLNLTKETYYQKLMLLDLTESIMSDILNGKWRTKNQKWVEAYCHYRDLKEQEKIMLRDLYLEDLTTLKSIQQECNSAYENLVKESISEENKKAYCLWLKEKNNIPRKILQTLAKKEHWLLIIWSSKNNEKALTRKEIFSAEKSDYYSKTLHLLEDKHQENYYELIVDKKDENQEKNLIQGFAFDEIEVNFILPYVPPTQPAPIYLKDLKKNRSADWAAVDINYATDDQGRFGYGFSFPATDLGIGIYPMKQNDTEFLLYISQGGNIFSMGGSPLKSVPMLNANSKTYIYPARSQELDLFGNIISTTDAESNTTTYTYSKRNQCIQYTYPETDVWQTNGTYYRRTTSVTHAYNERNFYLGEIDESGAMVGANVDAAGQAYQLLVGQGEVTESRAFNGLNQRWRHWDARGYKWQYQFNQNNFLIQQKSPLSPFFTNGRTWNYQVNQLGSRLSETDPGNNTRWYGYNFDQKIKFRVEPLGQVAFYDYDRNQQITQQSDNDGTLIWNRDPYFSILDTHIDLGGGTQKFYYDLKAQVIQQTIKDGIQPQTYLVNKRWSFLGWQYFPQLVDLPRQNITYTYQAGRLIQITDNSMQQIITKKYDREKHPLQTTLYQTDPVLGTVLLQDNKTIYDALYRITWSVSDGFTLVQGYDNLNNKVYGYSQLYNSGLPENPYIRQSWNSFDAAHRPLFDDGYFNPTTQTIEITALQGTNNSYSYNLRTGQSYQEDGVGVNTTLSYDPNQLLYSTSSSNFNQTRNYSIEGWLASYSSYDSIIFSSNNFLTECNVNGWTYYQSQNSNLLGYSSSSNTCFFSGYPNNPAFFTATGQALLQRTNWGNNDDSGWFYLNNAYLNGESKLFNTSSGQCWDNKAQEWSDYANVTLIWDANRSLSTKLGAQDDNNPNAQEARTAYYRNAWDGRNIYRSELPLSSSDQNSGTIINGMLRNFYAADDHYLASFFNSNEVEVAADTYLQYTVFQNSKRGGLCGGIINPPFNPANYNPSYGQGLFQAKSFQETYHADPLQALRNALQNLSPSGLGFWASQPLSTGAQRYIVAPGDTYQMIAQKLFGDNSFQTNIAAENGDSLDTPLAIGRSINVPAFVPFAYGEQVNIPYNQMINTIMGNLTPYFHFPPKKQHHSWWKTILEVFVAVVIAVIAPHLLPALIPGISSLAIAAVTGVITNIASQLTAMAVHDQSHFSWKSLAESLAGSFIPGAGTMSQFSFTKLLEIMMVAVEKDFLQQLISGRIDLKELLSSMVSAGIDAIADMKIPGNSISDRVIRGEFNQLSDSLISSTFHGRVDAVEVAASMVGTGLGGAISYPIADSLDEERLKSSMNAMRNQNSSQKQTVSSEQLKLKQPLSNLEKATLQQNVASMRKYGMDMWKAKDDAHRGDPTNTNKHGNNNDNDERNTSNNNNRVNDSRKYQSASAESTRESESYIGKVKNKIELSGKVAETFSAFYSAFSKEKLELNSSQKLFNELKDFQKSLQEEIVKTANPFEKNKLINTSKLISDTLLPEKLKAGNYYGMMLRENRTQVGTFFRSKAEFIEKYKVGYIVAGIGVILETVDPNNSGHREEAFLKAAGKAIFEYELGIAVTAAAAQFGIVGVPAFAIGMGVVWGSEQIYPTVTKLNNITASSLSHQNAVLQELSPLQQALVTSTFGH